VIKWPYSLIILLINKTYINAIFISKDFYIGLIFRILKIKWNYGCELWYLMSTAPFLLIKDTININCINVSYAKKS
jgi:hypothetical protein